MYRENKEAKCNKNNNLYSYFKLIKKEYTQSTYVITKGSCEGQLIIVEKNNNSWFLYEAREKYNMIIPEHTFKDGSIFYLAENKKSKKDALEFYLWLSDEDFFFNYQEKLNINKG
tara:strand:+ start:109 stop:453 length:345 start_codon:yes stop_codon:yes gene_type:complete